MTRIQVGATSSGASFSHAIMFHHFHSEWHPKVQGSINEKQFEQMLDWLSERCTLIDAEEYADKLDRNTLQEKEVCLTFDDALLCQFEVAYPVLKRRGLRAFFFIYSSPFNNEPDNLEIFRYFRTVAFDDINQFYKLFFKRVMNEDEVAYVAEKELFEQLNYLASSPFYSNEDKWFRYLRDRVLVKERYETIMSRIMHDLNFNIDEAATKLWMTNQHLSQLVGDGHTIGLHSYTHPTLMEKLTFKQQQIEFEKNLCHLESITGSDNIYSMSHPCGSYNEDTLSILKGMGIRIGFRSNISVKEIKSTLEIPRKNHANILKAMAQ